MITGLFIGRFQPFHNGHLAIIRQAFKKVDELLLVIGSTQLERTKDNPLNAEEREKLIEATIKDLKIEHVKIFHLPDIKRDDKYVDYVKKCLPPFQVVFTGENELNANLFVEAGYKVISSSRMYDWMATGIRERIRESKDYAMLVPKKIKELLVSEGYAQIIRNTK